MRTAKTLIRLGGCPGWSESSLGTEPHCWFCHVAAHLCFIKVLERTNKSKALIFQINSQSRSNSLTIIELLYPHPPNSHHHHIIKTRNDTICLFCFSIWNPCLALKGWTKLHIQPLLLENARLKHIIYYAPVICNHEPRRAGDSWGNVSGFYFCVVPAVQGECGDFVFVPK